MDLHERTLHLLDVEYLGGGWLHSGDGLALVLRRYRDTVGWRDGDHLIGAASHWVYVRIAFAAPSCLRLLPAGGGPDAADIRLIDEARHVDTTRYGRVVVASGDHRFTDLVVDLAAGGAEVWVAGYRFNTSRRLAAAADHVVDLADTPLALAA